MWGFLGIIAVCAGLIALGPIGWIILGVLFMFWTASKEEQKKADAKKRQEIEYERESARYKLWLLETTDKIIKEIIALTPLRSEYLSYLEEDIKNELDDRMEAIATAKRKGAISKDILNSANEIAILNTKLSALIDVMLSILNHDVVIKGELNSDLDNNHMIGCIVSGDMAELKKTRQSQIQEISNIIKTALSDNETMDEKMPQALLDDFREDKTRN